MNISIPNRWIIVSPVVYGNADAASLAKIRFPIIIFSASKVFNYFIFRCETRIFFKYATWTKTHRPPVWIREATRGDIASLVIPAPNSGRSAPFATKRAIVARVRSELGKIEDRPPRCTIKRRRSKFRILLSWLASSVSSFAGGQRGESIPSLLSKLPFPFEMQLLSTVRWSKQNDPQSMSRL